MRAADGARSRGGRQGSVRRRRRRRLAPPRSTATSRSRACATKAFASSRAKWSCSSGWARPARRASARSTGTSCVELRRHPHRARPRAVARVRLARGRRARRSSATRACSSASSTAARGSTASSRRSRRSRRRCWWRRPRSGSPMPSIRLLGLVVNVVVLYFLMGFRRFSHAISAIVAALSANDLQAARRALAAWRGGVRPRTSRVRTSRAWRSSADWSTRTGRCSRCCSGSSCCPVRRARCSIARRRCSPRSGAGR